MDKVGTTIALGEELLGKFKALRTRQIGMPSPTEIHSQYLAEIEGRLFQIDWASKQVRAMERTHIQHSYATASRLMSTAGQSHDDWALIISNLSVMRFMVEGIYASAWQVILVCRHIPKLTFRSNGLTHTRNNIIVHADGANSVNSWSYGVGDDGRGMIFANARSQRDLSKGTDNGLWPNLAEFYQMLTQKVDALGDDKAF